MVNELFQYYQVEAKDRNISKVASIPAIQLLIVILKVKIFTHTYQIQDFFCVDLQQQ